MAKYFIQLNTLFQRTRQYYQDGLVTTLEHVMDLLQVSEQLYETSVNTSLIAGGYQTTEEQWEVAPTHSLQSLQALDELVQATQKKETTTVVQEGQRGTQEWRER